MWKITATYSPALGITSDLNTEEVLGTSYGQEYADREEAVVDSECLALEREEYGLEDVEYHVEEVSGECA